MSGVTQSSGIRSILQSLQYAAAATSVTQNRLATGRRVNSALDNPQSYFTARSLTQRAGDLGALLDQIGQAEQTLKAASTGINGLVKLVKAAKSSALQARQAPLPQTTYSAIVQTGVDVSGEAIGTVVGNVDTSGAFAADVEGLQIKVGATTYTVHGSSTPGTENIAAILFDINHTAGLGPSGAVTASLDGSGKFIKLAANSSDTSFQVLSSAAATTLGIDGQSGNSTNLLQAVASLDGTSLTVRANGGGAKTITFGSGGGQVSTFNELQSALGGAGVSATIDGANLALSVDGTTTYQNSLTTSGSALGVLGLPAAGTEFGAVNAPTPDPTRASSQTQYNALLQQIDQLAADSFYGGLNPLTGGNVTTAFNESGSSALTVAGVSLDAAGLNLTAASGSDFQSNPVVDGVIAALDAALSSLRLQASSFGANLATLQTRQTFTRDLINTLQSGADALTLADTNEEGAHVLALQVRESLSLTALSLSVQSGQAALSLFR
jgi:flagellin-like hook-associated protein FlgL